MNWKSKLIKFWNFWPPFVGAGISIVRTESDELGFRALDVRLKLRFWNSNYVGTQFGGSLFAMTDPFYMVLLVRRLGRGYIVWDKSASIRYMKPGKTDCFARFEILPEELEAIKSEVDQKGRIDWLRLVQIRDRDGVVIAEVEKKIYIATRAYYEQSREKHSREKQKAIDQNVN